LKSLPALFASHHHHVANLEHSVHDKYVRFEALEYAGILKEARRSSNNKQLLAQTRDYCLRTVDGVRQDVRYQLDPSRMHRRLKRRMEQDKSGTVGFGTGAFLGFAL
jgi:hypothetical protein